MEGRRTTAVRPRFHVRNMSLRPILHISEMLLLGGLSLSLSLGSSGCAANDKRET